MFDGKNYSDPKTVREYLRLYLTGMGMGAADTVPGVSGGTIAFVTGIYHDLLNAIKSFNLDLIRLILKRDFKGALNHVPWRFLIALGLGIATAILSLARIVSWLMENQRIFLFAFFFGLVVASGIAVGTRIKRWTPLTIGGVIVGALAAYTIVGLVPVEMSHDPLMLFLSGMVAITAMILPGISGSSILLVLGQYHYVLNAVKNFDFVTLGSVAAGCVLGIGIFSRLLSWLLKRFEQPTIAVLIGFVIGSLRAVWPWQITETIVVAGYDEIVRTNILPDFASSEFLIALVIALMGFLLVSFIDHLQSRSNPIMRLIWRPRPQEQVAAGD